MTRKKHRHKWALYSTGWMGNLSCDNYEYACTVKGCKTKKFTEFPIKPKTLNNPTEKQ